MGYHKYCEKSCSLPLPARVIRSFNCCRKRKGIFSTIFVQMCKVAEAGLPNRASGDTSAVCGGQRTQSHFCQSRQYDSCGVQQKQDLALKDSYHAPRKELRGSHQTQGTAPGEGQADRRLLLGSKLPVSEKTGLKGLQIKPVPKALHTLHCTLQRR